MDIVPVAAYSIEGDAAPPLRFRLTARSGTWHLTEKSTGSVGGIFASMSAALAFARAEARKAPGTSIFVELTEIDEGKAA